ARLPRGVAHEDQRDGGIQPDGRAAEGGRLPQAARPGGRPAAGHGGDARAEGGRQAGRARDDGRQRAGQAGGGERDGGAGDGRDLRRVGGGGAGGGETDHTRRGRGRERRENPPRADDPRAVPPAPGASRPR